MFIELMKKKKGKRLVIVDIKIKVPSSARENQCFEYSKCGSFSYESKRKVL